MPNYYYYSAINPQSQMREGTNYIVWTVTGCFTATKSGKNDNFMSCAIEAGHDASF